MDKNDITVIFFLGIFAIAVMWAVIYLYRGEKEIKRREKAFDDYCKCFAARDRRHYVKKYEQENS